MPAVLKKDDIYGYLCSLLLEKHDLAHEYCHAINTVSVLDELDLTAWHLEASDRGMEYAYHTYLYKDNTAALVVNYKTNTRRITWVSVYANSPELAKQLYLEISTNLKPNVPEDLNKTGFNFFYHTQEGPKSQAKGLLTPSLEESLKNYPPLVQSEIMSLALTKPDMNKGRLILWHGPPGTGKTSAIRCLAREWRTWADFLYITDPDEYFNNPGYFYYTLIGSKHQQWMYPEAVPADDRWKLLIVEDSGEFLRQDAGVREKQAVSRLLNAADGLLGQGMKFLILITTNEPIRELSEAVSRPGRCLANTEFQLFSPAEASEWLGRPVSERKTLAELYQDSTKMQITPTKKIPVSIGQYL